MSTNLKAVVLLAGLALAGLGVGDARAEELPAYGGGVKPAAEPCCPEPLRKTCVPVDGVKKITKVEYDVKEVEYCQKKCPGFKLFQPVDCPPSDQCPTCGKLRHKKVLLKRTVTVDCPVSNSVPALVPEAPCAACNQGDPAVGAAKP